MYRFLFIWTAVLTLAGTLASDAFADGDFDRSCHNVGLIFPQNTGPTLVAECTKRDGTTETSGIVLTNLIANDNGHLVWRVGGGFSGSCQESRIREVPLLGAICTRNDGSPNPSTLNLAERIANLDGLLKYVGP